ncbi:MATE family efflux transporter [Pseudomonas citrulli]|uniref:MATE family efflux transporter n=1 Tax=Pseudomonas citrulli TaxID=3064347 RepID=A0ABT9C1B9_9PSED|nr:MATE family efflux transporter [Pseudomonas sp. K18]MDO7898598.1 MATE family efflux transporter [Pseudomonas sp. K18]
MEVSRIAIILTLSRLGDLTGSLIYFSFIGHFILDASSHASFAWAQISFLSVLGIGFFSRTLITVASSENLSEDNIEGDLIIALKLGILIGSLIFFATCLLNTATLETPRNANDTKYLKAVMLLSISIPAIFTQIVVFNFFNAIKRPEYEFLHLWLFNIVFTTFCVALIIKNPKPDLNHFILLYSGLRYLFAGLSLLLFKKKIYFYIPKFKYYQKIPAKKYANYLIRGLPMAICLGGESLLFLVLCFISKKLGDTSVSAYQASLHFLSMIYMISVGIGNATGIINARHHRMKKLNSLKATYGYGLCLGLTVLIPILIICHLLKEHISLIYTPHEPTRKTFENNLMISIPFLIFEYIYVFTRTTLKSMGDFWIPTMLTIVFFTILGTITTIALISFYSHSVYSIFIALVVCSFVLMVLLLLRFKYLLELNSNNILQKGRA